MESRLGSYDFDAIRVEPEAHRLICAGKFVELEPKAFALLLLFLEHPQELLSRQRLLDAVWGHQHVAPATLNRLVAMLRRALGEDVANPRYIQTVHGIGYRFAVTPGRAQRSLDVATSPALISTTDLPASDVVPAASATILPPDHATTSAAQMPRNRISRQHRWRLTLGAIALAAVLVFAVSYLHPTFSSSAVFVTKPPSIAVLPFTARDGDADLHATAEGLAESLTDAFARSPDMRVAGRESVLALGRSQASPQHVADVLDVDYVLSGEIIPASASIRSHVDLWHRGDIVPVWVDEQDSPRQQLFRTLLPLIDRVHRTMRPDVALPSLASGVPISAQDLYWLGRHYWYQRTPESLARALGYFQRAASENPDFAQAYCGIADTYMLLNEYADVSLDEASSKARAAMARARQIEPELADAYASEGVILMGELHADRAVVALEHALQLAPRHPEASVWYGTALAYSGRPRDALAWHQGIEKLDPLNPILQNYLGVDFLLLGKRAEATEKFSHAIQLNPDYTEPHWQVAFQEQLYGNIAKSIASLHSARHPRGAEGWVGFNLACSYLLLGDGQRALDTLSAAPDISASERLEIEVSALWQSNQIERVDKVLDASKPGAATASWHAALRARAAMLRGDDETARRAYSALFESALEQGDPFLRPWLPDLGLGHFAAWITLLPEDSAQRAVALRAYAAQIEAMAQAGVNLPVLTYQRAQIAALQGDAVQAAEQLAQAQAAGWLDAATFDRDRVWRRYAQTAWLIQARAQQSARIAAEHAAIGE